ncbi:ribonuclease HII [Leptospirillum ferrooxidans]|uniref:Ribonuclease HII n=1 Tax=Leptospirillum ferrooxidans (strain C2-3) TaxID=1162668 RepID=I0IPK7_LEPFC|nr:ribonuclease HII [Leptospirillum ferrooxidans]BAM07206.1 putative ribonuclease HII [Leptospirillum ferrooxidans C2-3]
MPHKRPDGSLEQSLLAQGCFRIAAVDEVGRGAIAGPVVVSCVVLTPSVQDFLGLGITDSKVLTPSARERIFKYLDRWAPSCTFGEASVAEIDSMNIREGTFLAMKRAILSLKEAPDILLVDGNESIPSRYFSGTPYENMKQKSIVGGDRLVLSIAAASIMAKVTRDQLMNEMDSLFPGYGFSKNKGYGTAEHRDQMKKNGLTRLHRKTFSKTFLTPK